MAKQLNTRIQLKHDFECNWITASNNGFIPKSGEIIIYDQEMHIDGVTPLVIDGKTAELPATGRTTFYTYPRMKIGDGVHSLYEIPFIENGETFPGPRYANTNYVSTLTQAQVRNIYAGRTSMSDNYTALSAGDIYFQY